MLQIAGSQASGDASSDEPKFYLCGKTNHHNLHIRGTENQHFTIQLKRASLHINVFVPYGAHRSPSVPFCKSPHRSYHFFFFFFNILWNVFSYSCRKPPTSQFHQGEALPPFRYAVQRSLMYTLPGMDWTLFQRLTLACSSPRTPTR